MPHAETEAAGAHARVRTFLRPCRCSAWLSLPSSGALGRCAQRGWPSQLSQTSVEWIPSRVLLELVRGCVGRPSDFRATTPLGRVAPAVGGRGPVLTLLAARASFPCERAKPALVKAVWPCERSLTVDRAWVECVCGRGRGDSARLRAPFQHCHGGRALLLGFIFGGACKHLS